MTESLQDEPYPCAACIGLAMCVGKDQYRVVMDCDILVDFLVNKYKDILSHFGRCNIIVGPLDKFFEMKYSHEKRGIVIGEPNRQNGFQTPGNRRIVVNPYYPRNKVSVSS
jgi:hypothetical protein